MHFICADIMERRVFLVFILLVSSTQVILGIPISEHLRINLTSNDTTNESVRTNYFYEIPSSVNLSSSMDIVTEDDEGISMDWIPEFLSKILPSSSFFSFQAEDPGTRVAPNNSSRAGMLSRLFSNIIIDRPSAFRIQFYNSDFEDGIDDDNSTTVPNAVFGSPLCLGLCVPIQVYSENATIHFLSDKQFSLFPPGPNPTPLYPLTVGGDQFNNLSSLSESKTGEEDTFEWLSSWIPTAPSLTKIQNSIQLPDFPFPDIG